MDAEHADAVTVRLTSEVLGELRDRGLGHRIRGHQWPPEHPGVAADVHDAATAPMHHLGEDELRAQQRAAEVHLHGAPPSVGFDLPRRPDGVHDAGVVDQQVHGAKLVAELRDRLGHGPVVADVGGGRRRDATGRFDQCARSCEPTTTNRGGAH